MTALETPVRPATSTASAAVVWIDPARAIVARTAEPDMTREILRGAEARAAYLARIVHAVGDAERVLILGPGDDRLALEREYVSLYRRPDRLVDVEPSGPIGIESLVARLEELAG